MALPVALVVVLSACSYDFDQYAAKHQTGSGTSGADSGAGGAGCGDAATGGGTTFDCGKVSGTVWSGHCYFAIGTVTGLSWNWARSACRLFSPSTHLVTITSAEEQQFIEHQFFPAVSDYWIGLSLTDTTEPPPPWCQADAPNCPFLWVTPEALSFTNWAVYKDGWEPNYTGACVRIELATQKWGDYWCDSQLPALCENDGS